MRSLIGWPRASSTPKSSSSAEPRGGCTRPVRLAPPPPRPILLSVDSFSRMRGRYGARSVRRDDGYPGGAACAQCGSPRAWVPSPTRWAKPNWGPARDGPASSSAPAWLLAHVTGLTYRCVLIDSRWTKAYRPGAAPTSADWWTLRVRLLTGSRSAAEGGASSTKQPPPPGDGREGA